MNLENLNLEERTSLIENLVKEGDSEFSKKQEFEYPPYNDILNYAKEHGEEKVPDVDYCVEKYYLDDVWVIRRFFGQGTFIDISKISEDPYDVRYWLNEETGETYRVPKHLPQPKGMTEIDKNEYYLCWLNSIHQNTEKTSE